MARPQKYNAEYFSHDQDMRNDDKIRAIRIKFDHVWYSIWNMLLEKLCHANHFKLEYTEENLELWGWDFTIDADKLKSIIDYFIKLKLIFLEEWYIYSKNMIERLQAVVDERERKREFARLMQEKKQNKKPKDEEVEELIPGETPQRKEKETKPKESKWKESIIYSETTHLFFEWDHEQSDWEKTFNIKKPELQKFYNHFTQKIWDLPLWKTKPAFDVEKQIENWKLNKFETPDDVQKKKKDKAKEIVNNDKKIEEELKQKQIMIVEKIKNKYNSLSEEEKENIRKQAEEFLKWIWLKKDGIWFEKMLTWKIHSLISKEYNLTD